MRTEQLRGIQKADLELANIQWTVSQWQKWCLNNNAGLILEDGKVTGWETEPQRFHG